MLYNYSFPELLTDYILAQINDIVNIVQVLQNKV